MFQTIKICGYKGISELDIYKIPQILLLGGRNNVGKSSLLEAIFLALDRLNPELLSRHFGFRGVPGLLLNPESMWAPSFNNYNLSHPINIELHDTRSKALKLAVQHDKEFTSYSVNRPQTQSDKLKEATATSSGIPRQALHITATYDGKSVQDSHLTIKEQGFVFQVKHAQPTNVLGVFISSIARSSPRDDAIRFSQLDIENNTDQIVKIVTLVEPRITKLSVAAIGENTEIHADVKGLPRKIPITLMGDGVGRTLSIVLAILTTKNGVVLIDEVENGIHHSKLGELWKAVMQACLASNCQLIATTHSYECLKAASQSVERAKSPSLAYVRLDRDKATGKIVPVTYSSAELSTALDDEFEVR